MWDLMLSGPAHSGEENWFGMFVSGGRYDIVCDGLSLGKIFRRSKSVTSENPPRCPCGKSLGGGMESGAIFIIIGAPGIGFVGIGDG